MKKKEAITKLNSRKDAPLLTNANTRFANINTRKEVWWLDIPVRCLKANSGNALNLVLYNHRTDELHHLSVPSTFFFKNLKGLVVRKDKDVITLELAVEAAHQLQDVRSKGAGISFKQFLQEEY